MKKILYSILAAAALFTLGSCVKETEKVADENLAKVTFDLQLDGVATKAFANGASANELYVGVYDLLTGELLPELSVEKQAISGKSASFSATLIKGRSYRIAFFAQKSDNPLYTVNLKNKTVVANYAAQVPCNSDDYDCFYKLYKLTNLAENKTESLRLTRPLAQINLLTSDKDLAGAYAMGYTPNTSSIKVSKVKNTLDLFEGTLTGTEADVIFAHAACKEPSFITGYNYVAMAYILADPSKTTKTVTMSVNLKGVEATTAALDYSFPLDYVPVCRNYRTNIMGSVFTADAVFTLDIEPTFEQTENVSILSTCAKPTFSQSGDNVSIATTTQGASIYYITGTGDPAELGEPTTLYESPIAITAANTAIKAVAKKNGWNDSEFATGTFSPGGSVNPPQPGGDVTDVIDLAFTGVSGTTYTAWGPTTATSGAAYKGQSAGGNDSVQLRSNSSNSGIVTTTSAGNVSKISVVWNDNTAIERTLDIYGKASAYSDPTDLYGDNKGTKLGSIVKGTSTELTITGEYPFIGLRSSSGAMYLTSISITWGSSQGGGDEPGGDEPGGDEPGGDEPAAAPITIDGDMSDWANIDALTSTGTSRIRSWKFIADDENLYFYFVTRKNRMRTAYNVSLVFATTIEDSYKTLQGLPDHYII